jgi:L-fucose isomerase-like protein
MLKVKLVFVLGTGPVMLFLPDGTLERTDGEDAIQSKVQLLHKQLKESLKSPEILSEPVMVRRESDIAALQQSTAQVDAFLVYLISNMPVPVNKFLSLRKPLIAFSGQCTPFRALHIFSEEREHNACITIALDYREIDEQIQMLETIKKLNDTKIALIASPSSIISKWHDLPDPEIIRRKLGSDLIAIDIGQLIAEAANISEAEAEDTSRKWMSEASEIIEPSPADILKAAKIHIALNRIFEQTGVGAMAIDCIRLLDLPEPTPACLSLTTLQNNGIPSACEADVTALLTMMILGYSANKPAFMGNIARLDPENNSLILSHCVMPTKMSGFSALPDPYILRNYHGHFGVTAYVNLKKGQEVTIARIARGLGKMVALKGNIIDCSDTTTCRITVSLAIENAREFAHMAIGRHYVMVYGNYIRELKLLCHTLDMELVYSGADH